jgi:acyl carrier protein
MTSKDINEELYKSVVDFVKKRTGRKEIKPESRLFQDLGTDGQDADELMAAFRDQFGVDFTNFVFERHFGPEWSFNPFVWFYWMLFEREKLNIPISVMDLYEAAENKIFPDLSQRAPV